MYIWNRCIYKRKTCAISTWGVPQECKQYKHTTLSTLLIGSLSLKSWTKHVTVNKQTIAKLSITKATNTPHPNITSFPVTPLVISHRFLGIRSDLQWWSAAMAKAIHQRLEIGPTDPSNCGSWDWILHAGWGLICLKKCESTFHSKPIGTTKFLPKSQFY